MADIKTVEVPSPIVLIDPYAHDPDRSAQLWARVPKDAKNKIKCLHPDQAVVQHAVAKFWKELCDYVESKGWDNYTHNEEFIEFVNNLTLADKRTPKVSTKKKNGQ